MGLFHFRNGAKFFFLLCYLQLIISPFFPPNYYKDYFVVGFLSGALATLICYSIRRTSILKSIFMMIFALEVIPYITKDTFNSPIHYQLGRFFCEQDKPLPIVVLSGFTHLTTGFHSLIHYLIKDTFICHSDIFLYPQLIGIIIFPIFANYAALYTSCHFVLIGLQAIYSMLMTIIK